MTNRVNKTHPGSLLKDYMTKCNLTIERVSSDIGIFVERLDAIIRGDVSLTIEECLRLGTYFNTGSDYWIEKQLSHDKDIVWHYIKDDLDQIVPVL